uniref:SOCS box domain-containing protein n=1 Tax=Trichogramma kaykai TaxID=54128 RepID=A0ABD2WK91_9HYME
MAWQYINYGYSQVIELLLTRGADPNAADMDGSQPLHSNCWKHEDHEIVSAKTLFEICDEKRRPLRVDAQTYESGRTPLLLALNRENKRMAEVLLRRGADPNLASYEGLAPLRVICDREHRSGILAEMLFKMCDELKRKVEGRREGRIGPYAAVKNLCPDTVDILLNRGADLSSFVFLFSKYFDAANKLEYYGKKSKLDIASRALAIVELLEKKGYRLDRRDVMITMKFFDRHHLFQKSADLDEFWYEDEQFAKKAKGIMLKDTNRSLSLYDSVRLRTKEVAKLFTNEDCLDFLGRLCYLPINYQEVCSRDLSEKLSARFFQRWALVSFLEVTSYRLPILCCEAILENLMNQDLYRICLTTTSQSDNESEKNVTTNVIKRYNPRPARTKKVPKKLQDYVG